MKCVKCNAEIEQDAQFCPYCGAKVEQVRQCSKCGKSLDDDSDFCPYCGTKRCVATTNNSIEKMMHVEDKCVSKEELIMHTPGNDAGGPKKWLWLICSFLLIGALCGGGYYFVFNKSESSAQAADSMTISELQSVDGAKQHLNEILPKAFKMQDKDAIHAYFSKEYQGLFDKIEELDNIGYGGEVGFWNGNIWDGGQEGNPDDFNIIKLSSSSDTNASVQVKFILQNGDFKSENIVSMNLVFENDNWFIDDTNNYKHQMKEYVKEAEEYAKSEFQLADLIYIQERGDLSYANNMFRFKGYTKKENGWVKGKYTIIFDGKVLSVEARSEDGNDPFPQDWGKDLGELERQGYKTEDSSVGMVFRTDYYKQGQPVISSGCCMDRYVVSIGKQVGF